MSDELHLFTGVQQRVISAYHPQCNGLVERQNRTIKNSCEGIGRNPLKQPSIIQGVLFAHRVSKRATAKYFFFRLLYNREPVLPTDVKKKLPSKENSDPDESFDKYIFDSVLAFSNVIRDLHRQAGETAQKKQ